MIRRRFLPAVCVAPDVPGYSLEEALASVGAGWWPLVREGMAAATRSGARVVQVKGRSLRTCERCGAGAPAGPRGSSTAGWIKTVCDACLPIDVRAWDPTCAGNFRHLPPEWFEDPRDHDLGPRWRHLDFDDDPSVPWASPPWTPPLSSWEPPREDPDA